VRTSPEPLTPTEARVAESVDRERLVESIQRLVAIESWDGRESPAQELMAEFMSEAGLEVDLWQIDLDEVSAHPDYSVEIEREHALGLVGTLPGAGEGPSLILNGHVDVVPPGAEELWSHPPFGGVVERGRIYGRGAVDMKGPLLAGLYAMIALHESGVELAGTVHLESVVAEEDGGMGTLATILRGYQANGAIVLEPTDLMVIPTQAGCLNFRVLVPGLAAHGAVREEGVSAFENLFGVYAAIQQLEAERNQARAGDPLYARFKLPFAISIGTIQGGDWTSSVPDHVTMEGRMGVAPGEDFDSVRGELEAAVAGAAARDVWLRDHPPEVEWWGGRFLPAQTPPDHPLVQSVRAAGSAVIGREVPLEGVTYGADMGLLANVGETPAVLFGAGDIRVAHRPDEYVKIEDLLTMVRTVAVTAMRFCG
jgi:acetylornithine deacetylase